MVRGRGEREEETEAKVPAKGVQQAARSATQATVS